MNKKRIPILANKCQCTGCSACMDACNNNALSIRQDDDGHKYVNIDKSSCIQCGLCEQVCPVISKLNYCDSDISRFYAAWNKDRNERKRSASGGVFYAMAKYIIERGGVAIGVTMEAPCEAHHIVINNVEQLNCLQGSKYIHSNTEGIYKETYRLLKKGITILFSGTGCQVAGLYSFLNKKKYTGELITIDIICGGVPSNLLKEKFFKLSPYNIKKVISFRTKENGWKPIGFRYNLKVEDVNGCIHDYTNIPNLLTSGFSSELTNRYSCYDCQFVGKKRMSDFTIGDYWGCFEYNNEHKDGVSLIVVHNKRALTFLEDLKDFLFFEETDDSIAVKYNHRLVDGYGVQKYFLERRFLPYIAKNFSDETFSKIYASTYSNYSPWIILKLYRKVMYSLIKLIHIGKTKL